MVLGVCGGIAAYKAAQVARDLTELGAAVDVVLTASATRFVGSLTFEGLTGRPVRGDIFEPGRGLDHIRLARSAAAVCIAPATADFMARAAAGRADDLPSAILLATRAPVLICPAMNDAMWSHPATRRNAGSLADLGYTLVGPATGPLAYDEGEGPGRMVEPEEIVHHVGRALGAAPPWKGLRIVVTAGPTREPVDAVRFLSNRSSGRMGTALAGAAWRRGADVLLVAGPLAVRPPPGVRVRRVDTAVAMQRAVGEELPGADALLMAAAVADFRPAAPDAGKIKRGEAPEALRLEPAPDVLLSTRDRRPAHLAVLGFALEAVDGAANARRKLEEKGMDMVVLNPATEADAGFESETNRAVLIHRDGGEEELPSAPKSDLADQILDRFERYLSPASP